MITLGSLFISACSSGTIQSKVYRNMAIAAATGAVLAQKEEQNRFGYLVAYSGLGAAIAAVVSLEYYDLDKEKRELSAQIKFLENIQNDSSSSSKNFNEYPEDLKKRTQNQSYDIYRLNRWTQRGPHLFVKETEAIEFKGSEK